MRVQSSGVVAQGIAESNSSFFSLGCMSYTLGVEGGWGKNMILGFGTPLGVEPQEVHSSN